jgi:hypothetical protein
VKHAVITDHDQTHGQTRDRRPAMTGHDRTLTPAKLLQAWQRDRVEGIDDPTRLQGNVRTMVAVPQAVAEGNVQRT